MWKDEDLNIAVISLVGGYEQRYSDLTNNDVELTRGAEAGGGRGGHSFVACLSHLTIDHASLSRRAPFLLLTETPTFIWGLITSMPWWGGGGGRKGIGEGAGVERG